MHFLLKKVEILFIMFYFAMSRLQNAVFCSIFVLSAIDILPISYRFKVVKNVIAMSWQIEFAHYINILYLCISRVHGRCISNLWECINRGGGVPPFLKGCDFIVYHISNFPERCETLMFFRKQRFI